MKIYKKNFFILSLFFASSLSALPELFEKLCSHFQIDPTQITDVQEDQLRETTLKITLDVGVPFILGLNEYTKYAIYPYLYWRKGPREAVETLTVDSIRWSAYKLSGRRSLMSCTEDEKRCKIIQLAANMAIDQCIRECVAKPFSHYLFELAPETKMDSSRELCRHVLVINSDK